MVSEEEQRGEENRGEQRQNAARAHVGEDVSLVCGCVRRWPVFSGPVCGEVMARRTKTGSKQGETTWAVNIH